LIIKTFFRAFYRAFISPSKPKKSFSQFGEDLIINLLLRESSIPKYYVDIGCHHPRRGSNTFKLYQENWKGLLVDLEFEKVLACRLARPRDKVVLSAVSDTEKLVDIYSPKNFSTNTTINVEGLANRTGYINIGSIKTETLTNILKNNNAPKKFALLSIDVEGVDFEVLKSIDLDEYSPEVICIECWESAKGIHGIILSKIYQHLVSNGYELKAWLGVSIIFSRNYD
jgi:FkbM family methyltransferase